MAQNSDKTRLIPPAASFDELSKNRTRDISSSARHPYHSSECNEQKITMPCAAGAPVPEVPPAPENADEEEHNIANANDNLKHPSHTAMRDTDEKGDRAAVVDCDVKHVLPSSGKVWSKSDDKSKSAGNLNVQANVESKAKAQKLSNSQPSICPSSTATNVTVPAGSFLPNSEAPTIDARGEQSSKGNLEIPEPSCSALKQKDNPLVKSKTCVIAPAFQHTHTLQQKKESESAGNNTDDTNSSILFQAGGEEIVTTQSEYELFLTNRPESANSSEKSDNSVETTQSTIGCSLRPKSISSGTYDSYDSSRSSSKAVTSVDCTTNESEAIQPTHAPIVFTAKDTQPRDTNIVSTKSDSMRKAKSSKKFGQASTKGALSRNFKVSARQNAMIAVWDTTWNDFRIISLIMSRRTKKLFQFITKIARVLGELLANHPFSPHKIIQLLRTQLNSDNTSRFLAKFGKASMVVLKAVVCILKFVVQVIRALCELLRRRIIPGTRTVAAKSYCATISFLLFLMYKCQGSVRVGHLRIASKFIHDGLINPFALHDLLGVSRDDVFTLSSPPVSQEGITTMDFWRSARWANNHAHSDTVDAGAKGSKDSKEAPFRLKGLNDLSRR